MSKKYRFDDENWKPVLGYDGLYEVSDMGRIRSLRKNKILKGGGLRYLGVVLCKGGVKKKRFNIHRLVANAFIPNPNNKPHVNHKFGDKNDNRASSLEWVTQKENCRHSFDTGLQKIHKGKKNHMYGRFGVDSNKGKPVLQVNFLNGKTVARWGSARQAALAIGVVPGSITACCRGEMSSCKGFSWVYAKSYKKSKQQ